jgi:hypothetical protein
MPRFVPREARPSAGGLLKIENASTSIKQKAFINTFGSPAIMAF